MLYHKDNKQIKEKKKLDFDMYRYLHMYPITDTALRSSIMADSKNGQSADFSLHSNLLF